MSFWNDLQRDLKPGGLSLHNSRACSVDTGLTLLRARPASALEHQAPSPAPGCRPPALRAGPGLPRRPHGWFGKGRPSRCVQNPSSLSLYFTLIMTLIFFHTWGAQNRLTSTWLKRQDLSLMGRHGGLGCRGVREAGVPERKGREGGQGPRLSSGSFLGTLKILRNLK